VNLEQCSGWDWMEASHSGERKKKRRRSRGCWTEWEKEKKREREKRVHQTNTFQVRIQAQLIHPEYFKRSDDSLNRIELGVNIISDTHDRQTHSTFWQRCAECSTECPHSCITQPSSTDRAGQVGHSSPFPPEGMPAAGWLLLSVPQYKVGSEYLPN
jgi:hypothetical protein